MHAYETGQPQAENIKKTDLYYERLFLNDCKFPDVEAFVILHCSTKNEMYPNEVKNNVIKT